MDPSSGRDPTETEFGRTEVKKGKRRSKADDWYSGEGRSRIAKGRIMKDFFDTFILEAQKGVRLEKIRSHHNCFKSKVFRTIAKERIIIFCKGD